MDTYQSFRDKAADAANAEQPQEGLDRPDFAGRGLQESSTFATKLAAEIDRRVLLRGVASLPVLTVAAGGAASLLAGESALAENLPRKLNPDRLPLTFQPVGETTEDVITVPQDYYSRVLIRWGDPLFEYVEPFDLENQSGRDQALRFGFNCDMVMGFPLRRIRRRTASYILAVNHEYTDGRLMFPDYPDGSDPDAVPTRNHVETEWAAHGISLVQMNLRGRNWVYSNRSPYNRRLTATSEYLLTGPAAGNPRLVTPADPTGTVVRGTLNNCAGGRTPWGTYLSCEENIDQYFANRSQITDPIILSDHTDYTISEGMTGRRWELYDPRFDVSTPEGIHEPYRFGWVVEVDPYNPQDIPKKRTALGRFKHEGCQVVRALDEQVVAYSGDDSRFEYVYKFVSSGRFDPTNPRGAANRDLLDAGTLYAARFNEDGTGQWLALDLDHPDTGPILRNATYMDADGNAAAPRFPSQAEVLINARRAGDAVQATPMDRPEDIEALKDDELRGNGMVYVNLTNNTQRTDDGGSTTPPPPGSRPNIRVTNAANPRAPNPAGHIIEISEDGGDNAATSFRWRIFLLAGDPQNPSFANPEDGEPQNVDVQGTFDGSRFACPDNMTIDEGFNLWLTTDGNPDVFPCNDQIIAVQAHTPPDHPVVALRFAVGPKGAELSGPLLTEDGDSFLFAVQHPGEGGALLGPDQVSNWPDRDFPKPSVVVVRRNDGGQIGGRIGRRSDKDWK
ncbi:PhoX family protein [Indioceanicola profundi]|uniref:PhoX family protein n=1 Tax=Indioceanicola profundi TaxID=2220096 RepID=UPI000E6ACC81|nr:PhoX family phosphatase [Indioceanicola profundi]